MRDGDSKAFNECKGVYGDTVELEAYSDKNHAKKNFVHRIMERRKSARTATGGSLKGRGRLTEKLVDQLSTYFTLAIKNTAKSDGSLEDLSNAVWRIFYHKSGRHQ